MATLGLERNGVRLCYGDVYATWPQIAFSAFFVFLLILVTIDLLTNEYTLQATEDILKWLSDVDFPTFLLLFAVFGIFAIVLLLPQTVLSVGAGYACSHRIDNGFLAFFVAVCLAFVTFVLGATAAFLLSRKVLPHSCTRNFFRHFRILDGLDHALKHRGRRINLLLRINPIVPYNALNYGLGLSSCTLRAYLEGMVGTLPYTCVAVYAGMVIGSVEDIDTIFMHTSALWICIYVLLGVAFVLSIMLVVRYTKAEMDDVATVVAQGDDCAQQAGGHRRCAGREGAMGSDSTMFGTFTTSAHDRRRDGGGLEEEMTTFDGNVLVRLPLLSDEDSRQEDATSGGDSVDL